MPRYTTGEVAKLCDVSVRTVQYYDSRGILTPSELSEGGRRLYSQEDLRRMKIICFLRSLDFSIDSIKELFAEEHPENVLSLLLDEQEKTLHTEIAEKQLRADKLDEVRQALKTVTHFSVESIGDVAHMVDNKKRLRKVRKVMLIAGAVMDIIEIGTLILWIRTGIWQPFAIGIAIVVAMGVWISYFYFNSVSYICPECHALFRPRFRDAFFAGHTPNTRKLTCPSCGHRGFCVETYEKENCHHE